MAWKSRRALVVVAVTGLTVICTLAVLNRYWSVTRSHTIEDIWPNPVERQRVYLSRWAQEVVEYQQATGSTPLNLEALQTWRSTTGRLKGPDGEGIEPQTPRDEWDTAIAYVSEGTQFTLVSAGPDRIMGTKDDITFSDTTLKRINAGFAAPAT